MTVSTLELCFEVSLATVVNTVAKKAQNFKSYCIYKTSNTLKILNILKLYILRKTFVAYFL